MRFDLPHRGLKYLQYYRKHNVYHCGWDLNRGAGNQDLGDPIYSWTDSQVIYVSPKPTRWNRHNGGFGLFIIFWHEALKLYSRYAHLNKVLVKVGAKVKVGEHVAECGNTGTTYSHLHWEVFRSEIVKLNKPKWRFYPSGRSKAWVVDHYEDGLALVENLNKESGKEWLETHFPEHKSSIWTVEQSEFLRDYAKRLKAWFT